MVLTSGSSSDDDDDDIYVSSAARLKALKKKNPLIPQPDSPTVGSVRSENVEVTNSRSGAKPTAVTVIPSNNTEKSSVCDVPQQQGGRRTRNSRRCQCSGHSQRNRAQINPPVTPGADSVVVQDDIPTFDISEDSFESKDHNISTGDDDYVVDVKVKWMSKGIVRLELRKHETFEKVFKHFADEEDVSEKQILLMRGNRKILKKDTPASIELRVIDILEGGVVSTVVANEEDNEDQCKVKLCRVKVQMAASKQKIEVELEMDEAFEKVVLDCAEKLNVDPSRIKLLFDGDSIAVDDTPESLDLEDQVCIDLHVAST